MERAGVVHRPGMAAQLMNELAPLLAADGFDLDDLDEDLDLDGLNKALSRAAERRNLELFTPVGEQRSRSIAVLREFSTALIESRTAEARAMLAALRPDPGDDRPSTAQVIGTGLGLLDTRHTDPAWEAVLRGARAPKWKGPARAVATDILALSRKGRAFDSLDSLVLRHRGEFVLQGTALAVAASVAALAVREGIGVADAAERLLRGARSAAPSAATGSAFGLPAGPPVLSSALIEEFGGWLEMGAEPGNGSSERARAVITVFETLCGLAASQGIDLDDPDDIDALLDLLFELDDPQTLEECLDVLHDYARFRAMSGGDVEEWVAAQGLVEDAIDECNPAPRALIDALEASDGMDPAVRRSALARTRIVSAVGELLAWLGESRAITAAGSPRRADIAAVAGMIGVRAEGVAKRPPQADLVELPDALDEPLPTPEVTYAQAARDVPMLSAWWEALQQADVLERTATRMRPGPEAPAWAAGALPPLDGAEILVSVYVAETLTQELHRDAWTFERGVATLAMSRLLEALAPEDFEAESADPMTAWLMPRALRKIGLLELAGLVEVGGGKRVVPPPLRGAVGRGLLMALALLAEQGS